MGGFVDVNVFACLLLLCSITMISSLKIHEHMTQNERATTFLSNEVPNYEVVPIHWPHVQRRDDRRYSGVRLTAFGSHIKLWLNPVDGVLAGDNMPIYNVKSEGTGLRIGQYLEPIKYMKVKIFEDLAKAATLAVNIDQNHQKRMSGVIGSEGLVVRPVPSRLVDRVRTHHQSINGNRLSDDHHYHIVYKKSTINSEKPLGKSLQMKEINEGIPDTVYPEILVIVDHDLYRKFHESLWELVPYLLGFWNGVDMEFRNLENPKYRLNIAGIVVPLDSHAFNFIHNCREDNKTLNGYKTLDFLGNWLRKHNDSIPLSSYDMAAVMSLSGFCSMASDGECYAGVVGMAFVKEICRGDNVKHHMGKVMIVQDLGGYDGIFNAVHELGHALGSGHDDVSGTVCLYEHGYIMAGQALHNSNSTKWSICSLSNFTSFIETEPKCIYNKPDQGQKLPRYLPGRIMNADEQCKRIKGTKAYKEHPSMCLNLRCYSTKYPGEYETAGSPAADGTRCGRGRICLYGRCIWERSINW